MSILGRLLGLFVAKPVRMTDPVFGTIVYAPDRRGTGFDSWHPTRETTYGCRVETFEDFVILAGEEGPSDRQRRVFQALLAAWPTIEMDLEARLWADYLAWGDGAVAAGEPVESGHGPPFSAPAEAYAAVLFHAIEVYAARGTGTRDCDVHFHVGVPWDSEHGRGVDVTDGAIRDIYPE